MKILRLRTEWALVLGMTLGSTIGLMSNDFFVGATISMLTPLIAIAINYAIGDERKSKIQESKSNKVYYIRINSEKGDVFR
ncbi:hypothetical protein CPT_Machias_017 [Staphylococcus phage Machias]|nr:hypothetical protein CPT_Machias_017 [Staphylococcus phage Machias]WPH64158.1 hypothetical protein [Staphylococcus phage vB_StaM_PB50]